MKKNLFLFVFSGRIFVAAALIIGLFQIGCYSSQSFSGRFRNEHISNNIVSGEPTLKIEEIAEFKQNGTSITGIYTRVWTPLRFSNCSGGVSAPITCTLLNDDTAQCTFPQYNERGFPCQPPLSIYSPAIGCGRASVDCAPFSITLIKSGEIVRIEMPEFELNGIFFEARSLEMLRLPSDDEVKDIILKDIRGNFLKHIRPESYDNVETLVENIKQSRDYDPKTKRVSYSYTATLTYYKNQEVSMKQTIFNTLPLEHTDTGWRKRSIKIVLQKPSESDQTIEDQTIKIMKNAE